MEKSNQFWSGYWMFVDGQSKAECANADQRDGWEVAEFQSRMTSAEERRQAALDATGRDIEQTQREMSRGEG